MRFSRGMRKRVPSQSHVEAEAGEINNDYNHVDVETGEKYPDKNPEWPFGVRFCLSYFVFQPENKSPTTHGLTRQSKESPHVPSASCPSHFYQRKTEVKYGTRSEEGEKKTDLDEAFMRRWEKHGDASLP
ncbi:hypothetical protein BU24DRAFT_236685 [Aaosphaeria arxii CBS 175.79]|uniref:Uncharacterized protein n=1 Tax=Aaosphaeria arxii CBS 175.79 TaxID=1450172 RepID=A0A6A5XJE5_9PLEO|nr:uncharacterized protein BU24DRAFT_236685 [Aaosphaeria arxii CBS 175.79]KAF2013388.1 hypothetical protein BU24DRAFT_236685 [Aaosphaeria arxii CBS 175.79]